MANLEDLGLGNLKYVNFTNVDDEDFEGIFDSKRMLIKTGETVSLPKFLAEHFAKHLCDKILLKQGGNKFGQANFEKPLLEKILGKVIVEKPTQPLPEIVLPKIPVETPKMTTTTGTMLEPEFPDKPRNTTDAPLKEWEGDNSEEIKKRGRPKKV